MKTGSCPIFKGKERTARRVGWYGRPLEKAVRVSVYVQINGSVGIVLLFLGWELPLGSQVMGNLFQERARLTIKEPI